MKEVTMGSGNFILSYVHACAAGKLALADCGPVWQLGIIAAILTAAIMSLAILRMLPQKQSAKN
jgi:hypothetical protein